MTVVFCQDGDMADELGLRERKKLERRRCIETAATELFRVNGFDGTTIEDIAASADIAPRTFFYYFATKEDVALADYNARLGRLIEELHARPSTEAPWASLRAAVVAVAKDYEVEQDDLILRLRIMAGTPSVYARSLQLQAGWEDSLAEALVARTPSSADEIGPRLLASAALACMRSSIRHWLVTSQQTPLPELVQTSFDQLSDGLAAVR